MSLNIKITQNNSLKNLYKVKVVDRNGSLLAAPGSTPTISAIPIVELNNYSNTDIMISNVTAAYTNAVAYTDSVVGNLTVSSLTDVIITEPIANNSTIIYNSANNKYTVTQMDFDGGTF